MRLIAMTALHDDDGAYEAIYNGQREVFFCDKVS